MFRGILIGAAAWMLITSIADIIGGGDVGEAVGCGIFGLVWKLFQKIFKK